MLTAVEPRGGKTYAMIERHLEPVKILISWNVQQETNNNTYTSPLEPGLSLSHMLS